MSRTELTRSRHHALVLAAGKGSRMGGPKALMQVHARPWWQLQSERLDAAGVSASWVVSPLVREAMLAAPEPPARLILGDPDAPMFSSILAGLQSLEPLDLDGVFILPVDTPAPSLPVWAALAQHPEPTIPAYHGTRGHPVHLPRAWIRQLFRTIIGGPPLESLRLDALIAPSAKIIEVPDPAICINLNTMADLHAFLNSPDPSSPEHS